MKLPLPPDVEFHEDICLLIHRPRGSLDRRTVNKIITVIGELEFTLKKPFNRFLDTLAADVVDLDAEYIRRVSLYRRHFYGNRPSIKTAILATDSTMAEHGRLHASLTEGSPIEVRVFQDRTAAAEWLDVPVRLLTPDHSHSDVP
jgi:predicted metal-dependent TIM-barrel fold hydrolase